MSKIKTSMILEEECLKCVDNLILSEIDTNTKFETLIKLIRNHYNYAMQSVSEMFTIYETAYLIQAFSKACPKYDMVSMKNYLISSIVEFSNLGSRGYFSDVNPYEDLIKKLETIDDFQAFAILNSIFSFWEDDSISTSKVQNLLICEKKSK